MLGHLHHKFEGSTICDASAISTMCFELLRSKETLKALSTDTRGIVGYNSLTKKDTSAAFSALQGPVHLQFDKDLVKKGLLVTASNFSGEIFPTRLYVFDILIAFDTCRHLNYCMSSLSYILKDVPKAKKDGLQLKVSDRIVLQFAQCFQSYFEAYNNFRILL
jgi:hypothetical protein